MHFEQFNLFRVLDIKYVGTHYVGCVSIVIQHNYSNGVVRAVHYNKVDAA